MKTVKITKIKRIEQVETDTDKICNGCIFNGNKHCELSNNLLEILRCVETVESINSPVVSEKQYIWVKDE